MQRLNGITKNYAWGSTTLLSELRGEDPSDEPEAEIWYGAHAAAPSTLDNGPTLLSQLTTSPEGLLGQQCVERFGPGLPFLLKLLAANRPLSIQVHPSIPQAQAGFAAEETAGVPADAPHRSFGDPNHKPELIAAITPFEALVGFRALDSTIALLTDLGVTNHFVDTLATKGFLAAVGYLLAPTSAEEQSNADAAIRSIVDGANVYNEPEWSNEADLLTRLSIIYPGDPGIGVAALLNRVLLQPGEAIFLDAGTMHAYVGGLGVEIMANCDNVIRGGLTSKHIDVDSLLEIVRPEAFAPVPISIENGRYHSPAPEFALTRVTPGTRFDVVGPSVVISTNGTTAVTEGSEQLDLRPAEAAWVPAGEHVQVTSTALGFIATVGTI